MNHPLTRFCRRWSALSLNLVVSGCFLLPISCGGIAALEPPRKDGGAIQADANTSDAPLEDASWETSVDCSELRRQYIAVFEDALVCDPSLDTVQCSSRVTIPDVNACPHAANQTASDKVTAARRAFEILDVSGCVLRLGTPCKTVSDAKCVPLPVGTSGACESR